MFEQYLYDGSREFHIKDVSTHETSLAESRDAAEAQLAANDIQLDRLQQRLYAEKKEGLIVLFQAMDAAGKDGTISHVLNCLSPHGVYEASFKAPSSLESSHDYLWRVAARTPARGEIAIFNRSQYEDVLIAKVKKLYKNQPHADRINMDTVIEKRYEDIRGFERYLYRNSIRTVKIFLNISKEKQAERFLRRIKEPEKNWKFSEHDVEERQYWDGYQKAFEDAINATATKNCPWYVIPADHKWYMRYLVSGIILSTLKDMNPQYPKVTKERLAEFGEWKEKLKNEIK